MKSNKYSSYFTQEYLMGPNSMKLLEEITDKVPGELSGKRVLDLGCGRMLTALFLAREINSKQIFATDLWIPANQNYKDIIALQEEDRIIPIHADANSLPYADGYFDAIISVDSYHYFGCQEGFFGGKILPLIKPGGYVLIAVPGLKKEFEGDMPPLITEWAQEEAYMFHSVDWWKDHLLKNVNGVELVFAGESAIFDEVWDDWLGSGHQFSLRDKEFFEKGLAQYLNFVVIITRKMKK